MLAGYHANLPFAPIFLAGAAVSLAAFAIFAASHSRSPTPSNDHSWQRQLCAGVALFVACGIATAIDVQWRAAAGLGHFISPAAGFVLAGLVLSGVTMSPIVFFACLAATVTGEADGFSALGVGLAAAMTLAAALAAKTLRDWLPIDLRLTSFRDVVRLSLAALGGGLPWALFAAIVLTASGTVGARAATTVALQWWIAAAAGSVVFGVPLIVWSSRGSWTFPMRQWFWLVALLAATEAVSLAAFSKAGPGVPSIWYTYPLIIGVAVGFQVRGVSVALLIVTGIAFWSASIGAYPFGTAAAGAPPVSLVQQYVLLTSLSALFVAAAVGERRNSAALRRNEARENSIVDTAREPIIVVDDRGCIALFNPAAERSFGYAASEVIGCNINMLMPDQNRSAHDGCIDRYRRARERKTGGTTLRLKGQRKEGSVFPLNLSVAEWRADGLTFYTGIIHEQSERARVEAALKENEFRLATAIEATGGGVYEQSVPAGERLFVSKRWLSILGHEELPVSAERFDDWLADQVHPDDRELRDEAMQAFLDGREQRYDTEVRKRHASGRWIWVRSFAQATERDQDGHVRRLSGMMLDITSRRAAEFRAAHFARHDTLTGLSNRALFTERLAAAATEADLSREHAGLVLVDLDHFKAINDTLGHPMGDAVLRVVTDRIRASIRSSDTAARLGGDEFAVVVAGAHARSDIDELAERLHAAVARPAILDGKEVPIEVSIGFAIYPDDAETGDLLMRHADLALYEAKRRGRNIAMAFQPRLAAAASHRSRIESDLRRAIAQDELVLHYQPQFDLSTGLVRSAEALVRWPRNGTTIPPDEFIPIAEASGTIRALGGWVLSHATQQQARWRAEGHNVTVAVNVSPVEASAESFPRVLERALAEANVPGEAIELEITEGMLIDTEATSVKAFLAACEQQGIGLAIDDFGKGYSALNYLVNLPISKVKIDRSFVARLENARSATLVEGIISLAHGLDKRIVAEGVETEAQHQSLRQMGCDDAQGFYLCEPVEADVMLRLLREQPTRRRSGSVH